MKKIVTLFSLLIITTAIFAQKGKVTSALSYKESGNLEKAYETIMIALDPENEKAAKSLGWPRAWEVKGEILQAIFREKKTGIVEEPLFKALEAYKKAIELDTKGKSAKSIMVDLTFLQTDFSNQAIAAYEAQDFKMAMRSFEKFMEISNLPLVNKTDAEVIDTAIIYNTGLAAYKAEDWDNAIKYFGKSAEVGYNGDVSYYYTFKSLSEKGDTVKAVEVLHESFEKYPENEAIIVELINYYINVGKPDESLRFLDLAIERQPKNVSFYTAKGSALERLEKQDEAIEVYKQAIEMDNTQFTPYYNLGVIYYNRATNFLNEATQLPPSATKEYDEKVAAGNKLLGQALPYFEKAYELDNSEVAILESLKLIYYRLQMTDKYNEVNKKLQNK